jgi:hypothetical protein
MLKNDEKMCSVINGSSEATAEEDRRHDNQVFLGLILALLTYLYIHYFCGLYKKVSLSPVPA